MNELIERARTLLQSRSPRERWLLVLVLAVLGLAAVHSWAITPLQGRLETARVESERLESELVRAQRMAEEVRRLRAELARVESQIEPGERTNLFTLLERLANEAQVRDRLESIKPKQPSSNSRYPETRVEVQLKGATLAQLVSLLHRIDTAPAALIVRSLRVKSREDDSGLLDVSFSVSSFERT